MFQKALLISRVLGYVASFLFSELGRSAALRLKYVKYRISPGSKSTGTAGDQETQNIVIVGASFAGYQTARVLASSLSFIPNSRYRIVVVEPHSHFHFTWVLPRFCVVGDHEHKAFIPYEGYVKGAAPGTLRWIADRVVHVSTEAIRLGSGEEIPYAFLVIATGSMASNSNSLPSRIGADAKAEGVQKLKQMQETVKDARNLVVVGGGAAGVELATDAKAQYPEKTVVLVHSRDTVMHRFGPELQAAATERLKKLGVQVVLGDRLISDNVENGFVTLKGGKQIECDTLVNCAGQRPASKLIADLSPESISESGHIRVKPTLQIADDSLPNIYACGDVADAGTQNPNARSAFHQAMVTSSNILMALEGQEPGYKYRPHFADALIKLTLGLDTSVTHLGDSNTEMLFWAKEKDLALMSKQAWKRMGATPFEDGSAPTDETLSGSHTNTAKVA